VPTVASKNFFDLHPVDKFRLPHAPAEHLAKIPAAARLLPVPNYGLPEDQLREFIRSYYASVSLMDAQVGRVLDALERLGLAGNTTVVFLSDHGWLLGEHGGQWQKRSLFEESARVPLIVRAPGMKGNGQPCRRPVELVDLHPTLAELAGLSVQPRLEGNSLKPLLANPQAAWDKPAFTQVTRNAESSITVAVDPTKPAFMGRSIRTERWCYIEWAAGREGTELYDMQADPGQLRNVVADPLHAQTVAQLKRRLAQPAAH
jgi:uncharacterized sulfatase